MQQIRIELRTLTATLKVEDYSQPQGEGRRTKGSGRGGAVSTRRLKIFN